MVLFVPLLVIAVENCVPSCLIIRDEVFELLHVIELVQELAPDAMVQFGALMVAEGPPVATQLDPFHEYPELQSYWQ